MSRAGKFAAVTNYRDMDDPSPGTASRGLLASRFLANGASARDYAAEVARDGASYRGFNFFAGDGSELWWVSHRADAPRRLEPGIYGLSNHLLDTPWPKVQRGKLRFAAALERGPAVDSLLELLADTSMAPDAELPDTGVGLERERLLSAARIVSPVYGTRCSTAVTCGAGRLRFAERPYDAQGEPGDTRRYDLAPGA